MNSNLPLYFLIVLIASCSSPKSEKDKAGGSPEIDSVAIRSASNISSFQMNTVQSNNFQEQLFFFCRTQVASIDEQVFVNFEELIFEKDKFQYTVVYTEKELIGSVSINKTEHQSIFKFAHYTETNLIPNLADSLKIIGSYYPSLNSHSASEQTISKIPFELNFTIYHSHIMQNPYSDSGFERSINNNEISETVVMRLNESRMYARNEMYLLARIRALTKRDLTLLKEDELSYFRNEIYARHGHQFKTGKMKAHFKSKEWYKPYYKDATPYLNDIEKNNATFIKSLEN